MKPRKTTRRSNRTSPRLLACLALGAGLFATAATTELGAQTSTPVDVGPLPSPPTTTSDAKCFIFVPGLNPVGGTLAAGSSGYTYDEVLSTVFGDGDGSNMISRIVSNQSSLPWPVSGGDPCKSLSSCPTEYRSSPNDNYWAVATYDSHSDPYWVGAYDVADRILDIIDGTGDERGRSCPAGSEVTVVAKSTGAAVMTYILGMSNVHRQDLDGNVDPNPEYPEFSAVAQKIARSVSVAGAHRGSYVADAAEDFCDESYWGLLSPLTLVQDAVCGATIDSLRTDVEVAGKIAHTPAKPIYTFAGMGEEGLEVGGVVVGGMLKKVMKTLGAYVGRSDGAVPYQSSLACAGPDPNTSRKEACESKVMAGFYTADVSSGHHIDISHDASLQRYRTASGYDLWQDILDPAVYAAMTVNVEVSSTIVASTGDVVRCAFANYTPSAADTPWWCKKVENDASGGGSSQSDDANFVHPEEYENTDVTVSGNSAYDYCVELAERVYDMCMLSPSATASECQKEFEKNRDKC